MRFIMISNIFVAALDLIHKGSEHLVGKLDFLKCVLSGKDIARNRH